MQLGIQLHLNIWFYNELTQNKNKILYTFLNEHWTTKRIKLLISSHFLNTSEANIIFKAVEIGLSLKLNNTTKVNQVKLVQIPDTLCNIVQYVRIYITYTYSTHFSIHFSNYFLCSFKNVSMMRLDCLFFTLFHLFL